jgi:SEC-C motif
VNRTLLGKETAVETENVESSAALESMDFNSPTEPGADPERAAGGPPPDAQTLVDRMLAAGEWPDPALLDEIVAAGDSAVAPLIAVLRTNPRGWPQELCLEVAMGLLSTLRHPDAIPAIIEILRRYPEDTGETAARALSIFGAIAFEPVFEFCRDPAVTGYYRTNAVSAAFNSAGDDPARRARLADFLRPLLADAIERFRQEPLLKETAEPDDESLDDNSDDEAYDAGVEEDLEDDDEFDDKPDDEQIEAQLRESAEKPYDGTQDIYAETFHLVCELTALADPEARDLIKTAFAEDMVQGLIDEAYVERHYKNGGEKPAELTDWLDSYRAEYRRKFLDPPAPVPQPRGAVPHLDRGTEPLPSPPPAAPGATIRKTGFAVGRNAPCWCGSGKKYKKCHLGKDTR